METLCFPQKEIVELYKKYLIEKVEILHVLTDTDSTALQFILFLTQTVICQKKSLGT